MPFHGKNEGSNPSRNTKFYLNVDIVGMNKLTKEEVEELINELGSKEFVKSGRKLTKEETNAILNYINQEMGVILCGLIKEGERMWPDNKPITLH